MDKMYALQIGTAIGLVALLQQPFDAQRARPSATVKQSNQQVQSDAEFLQLYDDIRLLEDILRKNPPKDATGNHGSREETTKYGAKWINQWFAPSNVEDVIEKTFYERTAKLVSRYGLKIPAESSIFTSGNSIIVGVPYTSDFLPEPIIKDYFIIDKFSLMSTESSIGGENTFNPYKTYISVANGQAFEVRSFPEVSSGLIPFFRNGDFFEIFDRIKEYNDNLVSSLSWGYGNHHPRVAFHEHQLYNIAKMLTEAVDYNSDPAAAGVLSKQEFSLNFTAKTGGGRIIIHTYTASSNENEDTRGQVSLSIGSGGDVKFWWQEEATITIGEKIELVGKPIHADLKIKFPISP